MSTSVVSHTFATPTIECDQGSASGKCVIWPRSATAAVAYNEGAATAAIVADKTSASGMSIIWPGQSPGPKKQASVASTRASSETGSCSAEDAERDMQSLEQGVCSSSSNIDVLVEKMNVLGLKDLQDLAMEMKRDDCNESLPTTAAGSPFPSSVSSCSQVEHTPCTPVTSTSLMCTPVRYAVSPAPCSPQRGDASQRTPPQYVATACAPQYTPQRMVQRITSGLCAKGGDASERKPWLTTGGSWGAATAAVAATRAAAASHTIPAPALNVTLSTSPAFHPVSAAADICLPAPSAEDATLANQTVGTGTEAAELCSADSLKCWLAGIAKHDISGEDLAERLRAAMPETYED